MSDVAKPADQRDLKTRLLEWFFGQDLATKMLVFICAGIYFGISVGVPTLRSWMHEDMDKISATHRETMNAVIKSWDEHNDRTINAFKEDQERDQKLMERLLGDKHVAAGDEAFARP
jgi:hypothetical protein